MLYLALSVFLGSVLGDFTPKTYYADLDGTAEDRWGEACKDYGEIAASVLPTVLDLIPSDLQPYYQEEAMNYYNNYITQPYKDDIDYLCECIGIPLEEGILVNLVYDFSAWCTSIIARDTEGHIYHARNQDYPPPLRNDTIDVVFYSSKNNNQTVFTATTFFGYVGIPTGVREEGWSVTIDARFLGSRYYENLLSIHNGYFPSGWLVREILQNAADFDTAYEMFSTTEIMAPIYYILGGTDFSNNGAVITRNETYSENPLLLSDSPYDWYIIETNYEWWHRAPIWDDRREHAIRNLDSIGPDGINFDELYWVLSQPPVLNSDTCYTILMGASDVDYYNCTVRTYEGAEQLPYYSYIKDAQTKEEKQKEIDEALIKIKNMN